MSEEPELRMWMVNPRIMCREHLLGEHRELHALAGMLRQGISLEGYLANGLLELQMLGIRHDALVMEMKRRGFRHDSPWDGTNARVYTEKLGKVDQALSFIELIDRCPRCADRACKEGQ